MGRVFVSKCILEEEFEPSLNGQGRTGYVGEKGQRGRADISVDEQES